MRFRGDRARRELARNANPPGEFKLDFGRSVGCALAAQQKDGPLRDEHPTYVLPAQLMICL